MTQAPIGTSQDWRQRLQEYQKACREDDLEGFARSKACRRYRFLHSHGTPDFIARNREYREGIQGPSPLKPPESYVAVTESADRVVAEVPPINYGYPIVERIVLIRLGGDWAIQDIYWPCTCNNPGQKLSNPGKCSMCNGAGHFPKPLFKARFLGLFTTVRVIEEKCDFCDGTGACRTCRNLEMPGWKSRYSVEAEGAGKIPPA